MSLSTSKPLLSVNITDNEKSGGSSHSPGRYAEHSTSPSPSYRYDDASSSTSCSPSSSPVRRRPKSPAHRRTSSTPLLRRSITALRDRLPPRKKIPHSVSAFFAPRVIGSVAIWLSAIWLLDQFLLPLPRLSALETIRPKEVVEIESAVDASSGPVVPLREGDDNLDSIDARWRPLSLLRPPDGPYPTLQPTRFLPDRCMVQFFMDGETDCGGDELGAEERLDATWFWVNGSDPRWLETQRHWKDKVGVDSPEKHYR